MEYRIGCSDTCGGSNSRSSTNPVKCQCFHRFLFVMASFSISWLHGFQVLQVSSPDPPAQLGLGGAKGVSLYRRAVGLSDWKKRPSSEVSCLMSVFVVLILHWISEDPIWPWKRRWASNLSWNHQPVWSRFYQIHWWTNNFFQELSHFSFQLQSFQDAARRAVAW